VLAFEPVAANFYALSKNVYLNGLEERIATYCVALSEVTGLDTVNLSSAAIGYSLHQYGKPRAGSPYAEPNSPQEMHGALGFTVDGFVEQFAPPFPNHIKIDVDGLELAILSGSISDPQ
jgi:FkbM family methyltransferase